MGHVAVLVSASVQHCRPEQFLQLDVLVVGCKHIFLLAWLDVFTVHHAVLFVHGGIVHNKVHKRLIVHGVNQKERFMALLVDDYVVDQDSQLVP